MSEIPIPEEYSKEKRSSPEISDGAKEKFAEWGIEEDKKRELQEILLETDYGQVENKLKGLASRPVYYSSTSDGREMVALIDHLDLENGVKQCAVNSFNLISSEKMQNWLNEVNADKDESQKLKISISGGHSRTHFNRGDSKHFWNTISHSSGDRVTIDSSFQEISDESENGYKGEAIITNPEEISFVPNLFLNVGEMHIYPDGNVNIKNTGQGETIGMSSEGDYAIGVSFMKDVSSNKLIPAITRVHEDGSVDISFRGPYSDTLYNQANLNEQEKIEINNYLDILSDVNFETDLSKAGNAFANRGRGVPTIRKTNYK